MSTLSPNVQQWLSGVLGTSFEAAKHIHSHQDEVYKIDTPGNQHYYLKIAKTLRAECENLKVLEPVLRVPHVIDFHGAGGSDERDYLLLDALQGQNLVELIEQWPIHRVVDTFAQAVRGLHSVDVAKIFPQASSKDVLLHGDIALPNIIISPHGQIGYIDFGQMSFGSPELDLADAIWSLQRNLGPDYGERFLHTYGPTPITPMIEKALAFRHKPSERS